MWNSPGNWFQYHFEILSTGGTAKTLKAAGLPVTEVSAYTGFPEILDGRVKTLQPKIHGGLLGRRQDPRHREQMQALNIEPIDLLVVNLYAFEKTVAKPGCTLEEAIENIDIGGPALLRAAAKNYPEVTVLTDPNDYPPGPPGIEIQRPDFLRYPFLPGQEGFRPYPGLRWGYQPLPESCGTP